MCPIPGCRREVPQDGRFGPQLFCRYHIQRKARHGSHWHPTYGSSDLLPYWNAAKIWVAEQRQRDDVHEAVAGLDSLLHRSGPVDPAMNLRGRSASYRARIALARVREAGATGEYLLALWVAVGALIEDDLGSHRSQEFRIVQTAKAVHRIASGTHRRWHFEHKGREVVHELHAYPRSSGLVLRQLGESLESICCLVAPQAVHETVALRTRLFGQHPSHLKGWRPIWDQRR
jgi:hypothetical protein